MPKVHEHDLIYSQQYLRQFYFKFSQKKIVMGKKIVVPSLDVTMIAFFPRNNYTLKYSFCPKSTGMCKY